MLIVSNKTKARGLFVLSTLILFLSMSLNIFVTDCDFGTQKFNGYINIYCPFAKNMAYTLYFLCFCIFCVAKKFREFRHAKENILINSWVVPCLTVSFNIFILSVLQNERTCKCNKMKSRGNDIEFEKEVNRKIDLCKAKVKYIYKEMLVITPFV